MIASNTGGHLTVVHIDIPSNRKTSLQHSCQSDALKQFHQGNSYVWRTALPRVASSNEHPSTAYKSAEFCAPNTGQKLKRIPIDKICIALAFSRMHVLDQMFQSCRKIVPARLVLDVASRLLLHLVQRSHPKVVRPSGGLPRLSRLKNLVGCYHSFNDQKV